MLTLRESVSAGTVAKLAEPAGGAAASADDMWRRRTELLFERFAVRWVIADLPLDKQKELLARYRMADQDTQRWVRETIDAAPRAVPAGAADLGRLPPRGGLRRGRGSR